MTIAELLTLADQASSFQHPQAKSSVPSVQARTILLSLMEHDLEQISQVKNAKLKDLGITQKELKAHLAKAKELSQEEWAALKKIRERLQEYKKELWDKIPHLSDDELVEKERKIHINKRFNVRDEWLPLH